MGMKMRAAISACALITFILTQPWRAHAFLYHLESNSASLSSIAMANQREIDILERSELLKVASQRTYDACSKAWLEFNAERSFQPDAPSIERYLRFLRVDLHQKASTLISKLAMLQQSYTVRFPECLYAFSIF